MQTSEHHFCKLIEGCMCVIFQRRRELQSVGATEVGMQYNHYFIQLLDSFVVVGTDVYSMRSDSEDNYNTPTPLPKQAAPSVAQVIPTGSIGYTCTN